MDDSNKKEKEKLTNLLDELNFITKDLKKL